METLPSKELLDELAKRGMTLVPTNRDGLAIKDEPKYRMEKAESRKTPRQSTRTMP